MARPQDCSEGYCEGAQKMRGQGSGGRERGAGGSFLKKALNCHISAIAPTSLWPGSQRADIYKWALGQADT